MLVKLTPAGQNKLLKEVVKSDLKINISLLFKRNSSFKRYYDKRLRKTLNFQTIFQ